MNPNAAAVHIGVRPNLKRQTKGYAERIGIPNSETIEAIKELKTGKCKKYDSIDDMYAAMGIDRRCGN